MTAESPPPNPDQKYIAVIGDLRHSRRIKDRAGLQNRLISNVKWLNDRYWRSNVRGENFASPMSLTAGDEVQALVRLYGLAAVAIEHLSDVAYPAELTFGLGLGTITTDLDENVALIDGPAFHNAREAIAKARSYGTWAAARGFGDEDDQVMTALLGMMGAIRLKRTARQVQIAHLVWEAKESGMPDPQNHVARQEGVSASVVSESLKAAAFTQYNLGSAALMRILSRQGETSTP